jgi:hypothetical protein
MNLTFKKAQSEWISVLHQGWAWSMYRKNLQVEKLIAQSTVQQRALLGFPNPGNRYWNKQTLMAVLARYGELGFDIEPYYNAYAGNGK